MYDLQKANVWKRISAALFDAIILSIVAVGLALLFSLIFDYDGHLDRMNELGEQYKTEYGVQNELTPEEEAALTEEERAALKEKKDAADTAFGEDKEVKQLFDRLVNISLLIITFPIMIGYVVMEFVIPLILKNGQTLGKKIFGVAVMRIDGVKLPSVLLFIRTVLGKCTVGTMLPVYGIYIITMIAFDVMNGSYIWLSIIMIALPLMAQMILFIATRNHTPLHDLLAQTVTVDMASQMIFDSPEAMLEYKKRIHAEDAEKRER